jgi:hypothetical protein
MDAPPFWSGNQDELDRAVSALKLGRRNSSSTLANISLGSSIVKPQALGEV